MSDQMAQREQARTRAKAWYQTNRDYVLARQKAFYLKEKNRGLVLARNRKYREENRERVLASKKASYRRNREKVRAQQAVYRAQNKDKIKARNDRYRQENREKILTRKRQHYSENRDKIRSRQWKAKHPYASPELLKHLHAFPAHALGKFRSGKACADCKRLGLRPAVCLECGRMGFDALAKHLRPAGLANRLHPAGVANRPLGVDPIHDMSPGEYRDKHGYGRHTGLTSPAFREQTQERIRKLSDTPERRRSLDNIRKRGQFAPKVSDEQVIDALASGLRVPEAAKRLGVSAGAVYLRARKLHLGTNINHQEQALVSRYLAAVRRHFRHAELHPSTEQLVSWHMGGLHSGRNDLFQKFTPYFPSFKKELTPGLIEQLIWDPSGGSVLLAATGRILKRARTPLIEATLPASDRLRSARKASTPRKSREQGENYNLAKKVQGLLLKCAEGLNARRAAQAQWSANRARCESALRQAGFTHQEDIDALIESKTAAGAAERIIARQKGLTFRRVQNAYSACKRSL